MKQAVTAEAVLETVWQRHASKRVPGRLAAPDQALVRPLAQELGEHAVQCVTDAIGHRHEALVQISASVLETLISLWSVCGLTPDEIWVELHKREQLGSLLMQLNQAQAQVPRRLLKPWRVDSTKLP